MFGWDRPVSPRIDAWRWYLGHLLAHRRTLLLAVLPGGLSALMTLPALWLLRFAIDTAIPARDIRHLLLAAGGILGCRLLAAVATLAFARLSMPLARDATARMRIGLAEHLQNIRWSDQAGLEAARTGGRIIHETERVEQLTHTMFYSVAPTVFPVIVYGGVLFYVSVWMALIFLVLTPILHLASRATARLLLRRIRVFQDAFERFNLGTYRLVQMLATARMQASEAPELARHSDNSEALGRAGTDMALAGIFNSQTNLLVVTAIAVTLLITGGVAVVREMMTVGELGAFVFALTQINAATSTSVGAISILLSGDEALLRLGEVRRFVSEDTGGGIAPPACWHAIHLDKVSFGYGDRPILHQRSLTIPAGQTTAIVAPNGIGKTSLLELIGGLHRPASGRILLDRQDLAATDRAAWRRQIGFVPQHPALFRGTVRENICFGRDNVDPAALEHAIRLAVLDPVLRVIPGGLDAAVGDYGQLLSGGERQRVAIARALLHRPELLILDEPTNHLDHGATAALIERLFKAPDRPTIIVATHDRGVLAAVDTILRLDTIGEEPAVQLPPPPPAAIGALS